VWRSTDGVNWTLVSMNLPPMTWTPSVAATVSGGAMWVVINGQSWSSADGISWAPRSGAAAIDSGLPREYASLNVYNNKLWYIGGTQVAPLNPGPPPTFTRVAQNDVWSSSDGIAWTLVSTNQFAARHQHAAFVLNNRLWIFGGQRFNNTAGPPPNDAWPTTDGVIWTPAATNTEMDRRSWLQGVVQQPGRVTLIGGIFRSYSNAAWTTTDGDNWSELLPHEFSPNILSRGVSFKGALWVIGGNRLDGLDTTTSGAVPRV